MGFVELTCNSCGSELSMDTNKLMAVCPYCGKKMTYDFETVSRLMQTSMVEKTKRIKSIENTKVEQIKGDVQKSKERAKTIQIFLMVFLFVIWMLFIYGLK